MLGNSLMHVYDHAFHVGHLAVSQRQGFIILLFQKEDRTLLTYWRPKPLLTPDYKILAKALANRLQKSFAMYCSFRSDSIGKRGTISNNTELLNDAIEYANE